MNIGLQLTLFTERRVRPIGGSAVGEADLATLAMIANFHEIDVQPTAMRMHRRAVLQTSPISTLIHVADQIGLTARLVQLKGHDFDILSLPAALQWEGDRFVVLEKAGHNRILIHDPLNGSNWYSRVEVEQRSNGIALEFHPRPKSKTAEKPRVKLSQLSQRVTGLKRSILQAILLSLVLQAYVLASPYYMQVAIDTALPALDLNLMTVLAVGFIVFTIINSTATLLRSFVLLYAGTSLSFAIATNIGRHLLRLPISWFSQRYIGDILSRFQSVSPIQQFLTQGAVSVLLDGCLVVLTLATMIFYSPTLALIAVVAFALYALVRFVTFSAQRGAQELAIIAAGKEQSTMIESLRGITTLRIFNKEVMRHSLWQSRLVDSMNGGAAVSRLGIWQMAANSLIFGIENIIAIWLGIRFVIQGGFSVGMIFAYMAYKSQFMQRGSSLIDQTATFKMLDLHLERLADISLSDEDECFATIGAPPRKFEGNIELREVSFRYSLDQAQILKDVTLSLRPGDYVALTGPSGGGKTTLAKLLTGLLRPESGELLIEGMPIARYGYRNYQERLGVVMQDDHLFAGSLADNIALFDETPELERIYSAASSAAIHDEILAMPLGYETTIGDMGSALSGGQRQRLLLARALYRQPVLLVIDEGTSQLDQENEDRVNAAVGGLGITRVIIAHRRETIQAADRCYRLIDGRLEEISSTQAALKTAL